VNVAALLSARALARRREMAVRAALGGTRGRLAAQLLTEIGLLFALGAAGGLALALAATRALERLSVPGDVPIRFVLTPDLRVLAFAVAVSLAMGMLVGLAPVRRALDVNVATPLRDGAGGSSARRGPLGGALVSGQLALSLVLLVGAGLFLRALQRGAAIHPGFESRRVVTAPLDAAAWGYDEARARTLTRALAERLARLPDVRAVSYATSAPLTLRSSGGDIERAGGGGTLPVQLLGVAPGYFAVLQQPLVAGRDVAPSDGAAGGRVAVVNQTLVRRLWPDAAGEADAVGRSFGYQGTRVTVVGVVRDARHVSLAEPVAPLVYLPLAQHWESRQVLLVRTAGDAGASAGTVARALGEAMRALDPELPRPAVATLDDAMGIGILPQRVAALVTASLGAVGVLLAAVGLYGTMAYAARRRSREVGIRVALGARRADVRRLILGEAGRLAAAGLVVGLGLAAAGTQLLRGLLFGLSPLDPLTYAATAALLAGVALVASWLPAREAAAASPMRVLREEG
jgi:predicted permease